MSLDFASCKEELAAKIVEAAKKYVESLGICHFSTAALTQMSCRPEEMAAELLVFGADIWPAAVAMDADTDADNSNLMAA